MIIIEGPDLAGKTTLAKMLVGRLNEHFKGALYRHLSRLPEGFNLLHGHIGLMPMEPVIVQDRLYMSEVAYSMARGEDPPLDPETYRLLDAHARMVGVVHVLMLPTEQVVRERYKARETAEMYSLETILEARKAYQCNMAEAGYEPDIDFCLLGDELPIEQILGKWITRRKRLRLL